MNINILRKYFRKNINIMNENNIILTGLPRSGTTLSVHLLNKLPNTVGLHEPIKFKEILDTDNENARIN